MKIHPCKLCGEQFPTFSHLDIHTRKHTGERPFSCDICGKGLITDQGLKVHQRIHSGVKPFKCGVCHKAFTRKGTLDAHQWIHRGGKNFQCPNCSRCFASQSTLCAHIKQCKISTQESRKGPLHCEICLRYFHSRKSFRDHEQGHSSAEKTVKCEDCRKKIYPEPKPMPRSQRPSYSCRLCGSQFQLLVGLHNHMKLHLGPLMDKCTDCVGMYLRKLRVPQEAPIKKVESMTSCLFCEKRLPKRDLEFHMRGHTQEFEEPQ